MSKRFKSLTIFGVILVALVLVISSSYAYWIMTQSQESNNSIVGGCLNFTMESQSNGITLEKSWPLNDFDGMQLEGYTFTVTNKCPNPVDYRIELNSLVEENVNYLSDEYIAVLLDYGYKEKLADLEELENTDSTIRSKKTIAYDTVLGNTTNTHKLRLWVDETATNEEQNKSFLSKVSVSAGQGIEKYYTPEECFTFNSSTTTKTITAFDENCYDTYGTDIVIPYQTNVEGEDEPVPVTRIAAGVFKGTAAAKPSVITSVEFPRSLTHILPSAFQYCQNLEKVIFKDGLVSLGNTAFGNNLYNPGKLSFIMLPETLESIGNSFIFNSIEQVIIPDSVTTLNGSFRNNQIKHLKIGSGLNTISSSAFAENKLESVDIPNNIKNISGSCFYKNQLKRITIPDNVTTISTLAFRENNLEEVIIGNGVKTIGDSAFALNPIKHLTIGNSVTTIDTRAFTNDVTDTDTTLPNYLTEVVIPSSVTNIGEMAFGTMTQGTVIRVQNSESNLTLGGSWNGQATVIYEPVN